MKNVEQVIADLEEHIRDPREGLPKDVFYFVSRLVPMVNVDLLVQDGAGRALLAWRDDEFSGKGWHIPGGIIRFKEEAKARIQIVALEELGVDVDFDPEPIAINEILCRHDTRGHFISLLYRCRVPSDYIPQNGDLSEGDVGFLQWHDSCPQNLVKVHEMYRKFI